MSNCLIPSQVVISVITTAERFEREIGFQTKETIYPELLQYFESVIGPVSLSGTVQIFKLKLTIADRPSDKHNNEGAKAKALEKLQTAIDGFLKKFEAMVKELHKKSMEANKKKPIFEFVYSISLPGK